MGVVEPAEQRQKRKEDLKKKVQVWGVSKTLSQAPPLLKKGYSNKRIHPFDLRLQTEWSHLSIGTTLEAEHIPSRYPYTVPTDPVTGTSRACGRRFPGGSPLEPPTSDMQCKVYVCDYRRHIGISLKMIIYKERGNGIIKVRKNVGLMVGHRDNRPLWSPLHPILPLFPHSLPPCCIEDKARFAF